MIVSPESLVNREWRYLRHRFKDRRDRLRCRFRQVTLIVAMTLGFPTGEQSAEVVVTESPDEL
jgi:hypothetical protein